MGSVNEGGMSRYSKLLIALAALLASAVVAPLPAGAGCPGCEEYTLDIPEEEDPATPAPAPTAPPVTGTAPVAPATGEPVPETAVPAAPVTTPEAAVDTSKPKKPKDTDPDPLPSQGPAPPDLTGIPALAASQTTEGAGTDAAGVLPLALALVAVAVVGAVLGARSRRPVE
jgi:hypothetical protein